MGKTEEKNQVVTWDEEKVLNRYSYEQFTSYRNQIILTRASCKHIVLIFVNFSNTQKKLNNFGNTEVKMIVNYPTIY